MTVSDRVQQNCHIYAIETAIEKGNKYNDGSKIIINWLKFIYLICLQTIRRWQYTETVCVWS